MGPLRDRAALLGDPVAVGAAAEASPHNVALQAERIERLGPVFGHPERQHVGLPRDGGGLESLELVDHLQQAVFAPEPVPIVDVLPPGEEADERRSRYGLDLPAQPPYSVAVDAGQDAPVAELHLRTAGGEPAAEYVAGALEAREGYVHGGAAHTQRIG